MNEALSLANKVALVTGGSRGIGRAIVLKCAALGADVCINYVRDEAAAESVANEARKFGVSAITAQADVSELPQANKLVQATLNHFKRLDILICNAGIWKGAPAEQLSEQLWDETIKINLRGTWTACKAAIPTMKEQGSGKIVIVSSTAGQRGEANFSNYAASKGAQISFTKALAQELGPYNINVNCVAPGWVDTEMSSGALSNEQRLSSILKEIPIGRVATAEEIAAPIVFLCTEWARHITGEILNVNGGSVLCG